MPAPGLDSVRELVRAVQDGKISEVDVNARLEELLTLVDSTTAAVEQAPKTIDWTPTMRWPAKPPPRASCC